MILEGMDEWIMFDFQNLLSELTVLYLSMVHIKMPRTEKIWVRNSHWPFARVLFICIYVFMNGSGYMSWVLLSALGCRVNSLPVFIGYLKRNMAIIVWSSKSDIFRILIDL